jgi:glycosyltransferase involved in cell wall biosynthesis
MFDSDKFAGALERLLTDTVLRRQMGEAARAYVRKNHDLDNNYGKIEEVLESIVRERGRH